MLERVYHLGLAPDVCCRQLRDYLTSVCYSEGAKYVRLYGDHVFIFGQGQEPDEASLITILHLPSELRPLAHRTRPKPFALAA